MAARNGYFSVYGDHVNPASTSYVVANFALRIAAVIGLFLAAYFLFQPTSANLLAMPTAAEPASALFSVDNGAGTIARMDGQIQLLAAGTETTVQNGDMIVAEDGRVQLEFPQGQQLSLDPGASLTIEHLDIRDGIQQVQLVVWAGRVAYTTVAETAVENYFYVSSTSSASKVDEGSIVLEVISPVETRYQVLAGTASIQMDAETVQLQAEQKVHALLGDPLIVQTDESAPSTDLATQTPQEIAPAAANTSGKSTSVSPTAAQAETEFSTAVETYDVLAGDTMWSIALRYGVDIETIRIANPSIADTNLLQIGQRLYIPTSFALTTSVATN